MKLSPTLALLGAVAILATAAGGCGGGDDDGSDSGGTQTPTAAQQGNTQQEDSGTGQGSGKGQGGSESSSADTNLGPVVTNPTNKQLGIVTGADNSLQRFGTTAQADELDQVVLNMRSFFRALARGNTKVACDYVTEAYLQSLEALAKQLSKGSSPTGCAALAAVVKQSPPGSIKFEANKGATATVLRVGIEDDTAIIMLRPKNKKLSYYTMTKDDDQWKASTLAIVTLP